MATNKPTVKKPQTRRKVGRPRTTFIMKPPVYVEMTVEEYESASQLLAAALSNIEGEEDA
jgi:hypothetical protein